MSLATDLTAREAEVIRILKLLSPHKDKFVVIGGYAVNSIASHRFSVDCDLILTRKKTAIIGRILKKEGYRVQRKHTSVEQFTKLVGGREVFVDLFLNKLICRQTGGCWAYDFIRRNSSESTVIGLTGTVTAFVPKRELLIAMKVHAGRGADLRDIVMMSEHADWKLVSKFANTGTKQKVIHQISNAMKTISKSQFSSSLKAEFSLTADVTPLIKRSVEGLSVMKTEIERHIS